MSNPPQDQDLPKLIVLDDYLSISPPYLTPLTNHLSITYYPNTLNPSNPSDLKSLITLLHPYTAISTMRERTPFPSTLLSQLPNLRILFTTGMRNLGIDTEYCKSHGISVVGTRYNYVNKDYHTTNEQNWALILGLVKLVSWNDYHLKSSPSSSSSLLSFSTSSFLEKIEDDKKRDLKWQTEPTTSLAGKRLAILGLGKLGLQCAITGILGFGMEVIAWSENLTQSKADDLVSSRGIIERGKIRVVDTKEELCREADVLSLHVVLSDRTRGIIGKKELGLMKESAMLVNSARGPLVHEGELLETLKKGGIKGYAADVFDLEPLPVDSEWRSMDWGKNGSSHVLLSPHNGYNDLETLRDMYEQTAGNIREWLLLLDGKERLSNQF